MPSHLARFRKKRTAVSSRRCERLRCSAPAQNHLIMDLARVPLEEKVNLCRKYFLGGFAFLPWLW